MTAPLGDQRLLHVILGVLAALGLLGFLYLTDSVIAEIVRTLG